MILSDALILSVSQLQTQQVMTSQIRSLIIFLCSLNEASFFTNYFDGGF